MKLLDIGNSVEIKQLMAAMGAKKIPTLPKPKFQRKIQIGPREIPDPEDQAITELLKGATEASYSEIANVSDGPLEYKGRKVVAYIRDQWLGWGNNRYRMGGYKYHLVNCKTLIQMWSRNRAYRYLATTRSDGEFEVYEIRGRRGKRTEPNKKKIVSLELCKNCKAVLEDKDEYPLPYSLEKFFEQFDSYTPKSIPTIDAVTTHQDYEPDHDQRSKKYREAAKYKCQFCNVYCGSSADTKLLLHLHHIDGNPSNNEHENLQVLCFHCHGKVGPHLLRPGNAKEKVQRILHLRHEQGIISVHE